MQCVFNQANVTKVPTPLNENTDTWLSYGKNQGNIPMYGHDRVIVGSNLVSSGGETWIA